MPVAIFQAGIAIFSEGMRAKAKSLGLVRLTARFENVGKVRAKCGQSEGKYTERREKSLLHSIYSPLLFAAVPPRTPATALATTLAMPPTTCPPPTCACQPRARPVLLEKSARSACHARAINAAKSEYLNAITQGM